MGSLLSRHKAKIVAENTLYKVDSKDHLSISSRAFEVIDKEALRIYYDTLAKKSISSTVSRDSSVHSNNSYKNLQRLVYFRDK